ncbi:MAG: hypothetical protein ABI461_21375 [Polyangiaceae bacterium]
MLRWRAVLWSVLVGLWVFGFSMLWIALVALEAHRTLSSLAVVVLIWAALTPSAIALSFPWLIVDRLTKRANFKLNYYVTHFLLVFPRVGEPYGAACLAAALTLARRGSPTRAELDWIDVRLAKETRALGLFATAFGFVQALEARLARDQNRRSDADAFRERARIVFGTVTYLSPAAAPAVVRKLASEFLTLDAARRGEWSAVETVEQRDLSPTTLAIRGWLRKNLLKRDEKETRASRSAAKLPIAVRLATRGNVEPQLDTDAAFARMSRDYVALMKREALPPRAIMNLLHGLDLFFDPRSPATRLGPDLLNDESACAEIADNIADAVFAPLQARGAPVFAMRVHGAISARVYQKLETYVMNELKSALAATRDRTVRLMRGTNREEWLEVSKVRALYRRIEYTLGPAAAGSFAQAMYFNYGNFGVMLSESLPRRRPLAFAVFHCLRNEANRFQNSDALARENKNMTVTCRVD